VNGAGTLVAQTCRITRAANSPDDDNRGVSRPAESAWAREHWHIRTNVATLPDFGSVSREASQMNLSGESNVHILSADQSRRLLEVHQHVAASPTPRAGLRQLARSIGDITGVKAAFVAKADGRWTVLAESRAAPPLPPPDAGAWHVVDRTAAALEHGVQACRHDWVDWTLVGLATRGEHPGVLMLEGDWTLSGPALIQFAQNLLFAERAYAASSQAHIGVATYRLTRRLTRVTGLNEVCAVVLRHVVRTVPSRLAAFAIPTDEGFLTIVATHGYPKALVEDIRIAPGSGVIGSVYQMRAPLWVPDVTTVPGLQRRRPRYRTNSFIALPLFVGAEVLGVVCVTDRLDNRGFTRDDVSALRALTAPAVLALARERARQQAETFAQAAIVDPVSGLFNRRYFHSRLDEELQRAQRHKTPVALLMIDIDDFKNINDRFGHLVGDAVIRGVSEILRHSVRKFDVCARFGGEEFAIVMPGSAAESSTRVAERIRQRIEAFRLDQSADLRVTASIGMSVSHDLAARELIEQADQALYEAKRHGKNRLIGWEPTGRDARDAGGEIGAGNPPFSRLSDSRRLEW
jgi:diguanylate cyclase (GGDEF)-like protein